VAKVSNRVAKLITGLMVVIGLAATGAGAWTMIKGIQTNSWPTTFGTVRSSELSSSQGDHGHMFYSAHVTYTYQIGKTSFTGKKISVAQIASSSNYAREILGRYPVGKKVLVFYSPGDPSEAVLQTGIGPGTWICFGVGVVFLLAGGITARIFKLAAEPMPAAGAYSKSGILVFRMVGLLVLAMGSFCFFGNPSQGTPSWVAYLAASMFVFVGLAMMAYGFWNGLLSKLLIWTAVFAFVAVFNWMAFGPGERSGTVTTPFSRGSSANVRGPFIFAAIALDIIVPLWILKRRRRLP
jgi:hypothetical protein